MIDEQVIEQPAEVAAAAVAADSVTQEPERLRDRLGRFQAAVEAIQAQAEPVTEQQPETAEQIQPEAADEPGAASEPIAEGPSDNMLAFARAVGIPDDVLSQATDDADLRLLLSVAHRFQAPRGEQAPAQEQIPAEPEFKFEWPDEEIPPTDAVRREVERMFKHFADRDRSRGEELQTFAEWAVSKGKLDQQREELTRMQEFDRALDALKIPQFGESAKLVRNKSPEWHARNESYAAFRTMTDQLGFTSDQAAAALAAKAGHKPSHTSVAQIVRQQALTRLGGGAPRPAPAVAETREQRWEREMSQRLEGK